MMWNTSLACQVGKPGKQFHPDVCRCDRLIHIVGQIGKGLFAHLVRKKQESACPPIFTTVTHGYIKRRRREEAVGTVKIMKPRLERARVSHSVSLLDLSNAFGSVRFSHIDSVLPTVICAEDLDICQTSYKESVLSS